MGLDGGNRTQETSWMITCVAQPAIIHPAWLAYCNGKKLQKEKNQVEFNIWLQKRAKWRVPTSGWGLTLTTTTQWSTDDLTGKIFQNFVPYKASLLGLITDTTEIPLTGYHMRLSKEVVIVKRITGKKESVPPLRSSTVDFRWTCRAHAQNDNSDRLLIFCTIIDQLLVFHTTTDNLMWQKPILHKNHIHGT